MRKLSLKLSTPIFNITSFCSSQINFYKSFVDLIDLGSNKSEVCFDQICSKVSKLFFSSLSSCNSFIDMFQLLYKSELIPVKKVSDHVLVGLANTTSVLSVITSGKGLCDSALSLYEEVSKDQAKGTKELSPKTQKAIQAVVSKSLAFIGASLRSIAFFAGIQISSVIFLAISTISLILNLVGNIDEFNAMLGNNHSHTFFLDSSDHLPA